ncbi:HEPN domain-containing protein [Pedobacter sp. ASV28]|uniref:HEPN domain-containing protein n=1 Tax=Pedobacter sp. ASV28 TaxID=2795123 RepID=UPI0018EAA2BD|nr:HEPN domain-containing protein [Pedobacter sp. ASV28]
METVEYLANTTGTVNEVDHHRIVELFFDKYTHSDIYHKLSSLYRLYRTQSNVTEAALCDQQNFLESLMDLLRSMSAISQDVKGIHDISKFAFRAEYTVMSLNGIISLLKEAIPIGTIYNISKSIQKPDLIIVLEKSCTKCYEEFEDMLSLSLLGYPDGVCTIHSYGSLCHQINTGNFFYNSVCIEDNIVYRKDNEVIVKKFSPELFVKIRLNIESIFKADMERVAGFLKGADYYLGIQGCTMPVFMLQQACELTYRCLLNVLKGKDIKCHSLYVLRKNVRRFAPEIIGVFSMVEEEELAFLKLLEEGYTKARYQREYEVDRSTILFLRDKLRELYQKVIHLFDYKMESFSCEFNNVGPLAI